MSSIIPEKELGRGIDGFHPETKLAEGFQPNVVNMDPSYNGSLKTRKGYQLVAGWPPIRLIDVDGSSSAIHTFTLADGYTLGDVVPGPIILYYRLIRYDAAATATASRVGVATWMATYTKSAANTITVDFGSPVNFPGTIFQEDDTTNTSSGWGLEAWVWGIDPRFYSVAGQDAAADELTAKVTAVAPRITDEEQELVATFAGNLYKTIAPGDVVNSKVLMSPTTAYIGTITTAGVYFGPAIYGSVPVQAPDRGYVVVSGAESGTLQVVSSTYDSGTGYTTYVLSAPSLVASTTLEDIIRPGFDYLTVSGAAYGVLNGEFPIVDATYAANQLTIVCDNTANAAVDQQRSDDSGMGLAGVFTDVATVSAGVFVRGDLLLSSSGDQEATVVEFFEADALATIGPFADVVAASVFTETERTSTGLIAAPGSNDYVTGDVVEIGGETYRVLWYDVTTAVTAGITGDGTTATMLFSSSGVETVVNLELALDFIASDFGQLAGAGSAPHIQVIGSGPYDGNHRVLTASDTDATVTFASSATESRSTPATRTLNYVMTLDRPLTYRHGDTVSLVSRWQLIAPPDVPQKRTSRTLNRAFTFDTESATEQLPVTLVQQGENLYATDGVRPVQKYDGEFAYRAGLPKWDPLVGLDIHQNGPNPIVNPFPVVPGTVSGSGRHVTSTTHADATSFDPGDEIVIVSGSSFPYSMQKAVVKATDATIGHIYLDRYITLTGSVSIYRELRFRYYYRYVGEDATGQVTVSGAAESQDAIVSFGIDSTVTKKLACYQAADVFNYKNLFLEIYRTDTDADGIPRGTPPFYRIARIPVRYSFEAEQERIDRSRHFELFEDTTQVGAAAASGALDPTSVLTGGASVGAGWDEPPRAKAATTLSNRLVLGNITGYPEVTLALRPSAQQTSTVIAPTLLNGVKIALSRSDTDTLDSYNNGTTQVYEFVQLDSTPAPTLRTSVVLQKTADTNVLRFFAPTSTIPAGIGVGSWLYAYKQRDISASASEGLDFYGWFQVYAAANSGADSTYDVVYPFRAVPSVSSVDAGTETITFSAAHGLSLGTPVFLTDTPPGGTATGRQYYIIPVSATEAQLAGTLDDALTGTPINLTSTVTTFTVQIGYAYAEAGGAPEDSRFTLVFATDPDNVPVPYFSDQTDELVGEYRSGAQITPSSSFVQRLVQRLSRAINSTHAGAQERVSTNNALVREQNWLASQSGSEFPLGSIYLRRLRLLSADEPPVAQDNFYLEVQGTTDSAGREKLYVFGNDRRIANFSFPSTSVNAGGDSVYLVGHGLQTGDRIRYTLLTGTNLSGLTSGTIYYAIKLSDNEFQFATSAANAEAGTAVALGTTTGSNFAISSIFEAVAPRFPSRLVRSYPNYPEVFDRPYGVNDLLDSDSAIDVNPNDGQEISNVIPFYGDSFSRASQQEARLVVVKDRNVYMVNVETREVDQIVTMGHGASLSRSVADTKDGIMFADAKGVYKINRQGQWIYLGQIVGRLWDEAFNPRVENDTVPVATHNAGGNKYMLSLPAADSGYSLNRKVLAYDHTREEGGERGSWTIYDGVPANTWTNYLGVSHYGSYWGEIKAERPGLQAADYTDDGSQFETVAELRPMDFGAMGSRKRLSRVTVQIRRPFGTQIDSLRLYSIIDNSKVALQADSFTLEYTAPSTGTGDEEQASVYSISFSVPERKAEYFQVVIEGTESGEPVEICQVAYHVEMLAPAGTLEAGET